MREHLTEAEIEKICREVPKFKYKKYYTIYGEVWARPGLTVREIEEWHSIFKEPKNEPIRVSCCSCQEEHCFC